MPVHDMNIARASALSLYMTRTTPYVNTMAGSAISGHARAAAGRPGVGRSVVLFKRTSTGKGLTLPTALLDDEALLYHH